MGLPTHRDMTHHLSLCIDTACKQCTTHFLSLFHNQKRFIWTEAHCTQAHTHTQILPHSPANTMCIVCAGMSRGIDRGARCWWSDPTVKSLCGLVPLCWCDTQRRDSRRRGEGIVRKPRCLWSGGGLYVSHWGGSSAVLGLHHKDYCNTVQMGPCCNRLGWVDWTTGGVEEGAKVGWWMASPALGTNQQSWSSTQKLRNRTLCLSKIKIQTDFMTFLPRS